MKKFEKFETPVQNSMEERAYFERVKDVNKFLGTIAGELRRENIPVDDEARITIGAFADAYPDTKKDMLEIKALQRKFNQNVPASEAHEKRLESKGEQLEILAAIALFKKLRNRFIVARTSLYDDYKNKVDMLIIERATNTPLCTIDEVSAIGGPKFEQKKAFTLEQNGRRHGATVKYGLSVSEDGTQIDKTEMLHIPSFYLPLPPDRLAAGMKEVELSLEKESEFENNFFEYFKTTIAAQTAGALFAYPNMDNTMKKRLIALQDAIANMDNTMEATTGKTAL